MLFWFLLGTVAYAYVGYPALLWLTVRLRGRQAPPVLPADSASLPRVSVMLPVHNEAGWVRRRIENLLALRYPRDRLEIVVGSDASTDGTSEIVRALGEDGVRFIEAPERCGKTALLNQMIAVSSGEVIVFTDANARFAEDALEHLVRPFASPKVGCVVGELVYVNRDLPTIRAGEGLYWRLENAIKEMESRFGGTVVATGAIYAMRRRLWRSLPPGVSDDALNPLLVLAAGYDVVVEPLAKAFENAATSLRDEFHRKARMVTRQLAAHGQVRCFLRPFHPFLALRLMSHKLLRWLAPLFLVGALLINVCLLDHWFHRLALVGAVAGLAAFGLGVLAGRRWQSVPALLRLWVYFCIVNLAAVKGIVDYLRGRQRVSWTISPTTR